MKSNSSFMIINQQVPRMLPASLKLKVFTSNVFFTLGIIFFLIGIVFVGVFSTMMDFRSMSFGKDIARVPGTLISREYANARMNNQEIYRYTYQYSVNGQAYTGESYATRREEQQGDAVVVEYERQDAAFSKIQGMIFSPFPAILLLPVSIFALVGIAFLIVAGVKYSKNIRILQNGLLTTGRVLRKERTSTRINRRYVYKVFFEFQAADGKKYTSHSSTHITELVEDEPEEMLVYLPEAPEKAVMLDTLHKSVRQFFENR